MSGAQKELLCRSVHVFGLLVESILLSYVTPISVAASVYGASVLLSVIVGFRLYLSSWGVIRVSVDLAGATFFCLSEDTIPVC